MRAKESNRQLDFEVARIFLAVLSSEQVASAARNRVSVATKAKVDAGKRFEHGLAGENDVTRAELELSSAELVATDADASTREIRLQLERYVGPAAHDALVPPAELFAARDTTAEALKEQAVEQRPDLAALRAEAEAARIAANEPLWGLVPKLTLDAFYDITTQEGFTGENTNWGVSVSANWILYDRGLRYREQEERSAMAREATLQLERALDDTATEVARALVALERAKVGLTRAETRVALAKKNAEEVAVRYREGITTAFELADANAQEFTANAELARARFDLGVSILAVREIAGSAPL
jgi:outer membrane protein TolC